MKEAYFLPCKAGMKRIRKYVVRKSSTADPRPAGKAFSIHKRAVSTGSMYTTPFSTKRLAR
jgi:hypothetical protein